MFLFGSCGDSTPGKRRRPVSSVLKPYSVGASKRDSSSDIPEHWARAGHTSPHGTKSLRHEEEQSVECWAR